MAINWIMPKGRRAAFLRAGRPLRFAPASAALIALAAAGARADHFTATWKPNTTGNWTDAANWLNSPTFPNNSGSNTFDAILNDPAGNCTLNAAATVSGWTLGAGTLSGNGAGALSILGVSTWSGGALDGAGTISLISSAPLFINGAEHWLGQFHITSGPASLTTWTAGAITGTGAQGGVFDNAGTFIDATDSAWTWSAGQSPVFNNLAGSRYQKTGTLNTFKEFQPAFNNAGTVDVVSAELWLRGGGAHSGTFTVTTDATLLFSDFNETRAALGSPTTTLAAGSVVRSQGFVDFPHLDSSSHSDVLGTFDSVKTVIAPGPDGAVRFLGGARVGNNIVGDWYVDSGTLQFSTGQPDGIAMTRLIMTGGRVGGTDNVRVLTDFNWTAGTLAGFRTTFAQGGIHLFNANNVKSLIDHTLINQTGTAGWSAGTLSLSNSAMYNEPPATFDVQFDGTMLDASSAQHSAFVNRGAFLKSSGAGTAALQDVGFYNAGTVDVRSGTLRLAGGGVHDGTFIIASNATLQFASTNFQNFDPNHRFHATAVLSGGDSGGGTLQLLGAATFDAGAKINVAAMRIDGSGAATIAAGGALVDAGTITIDTAGGARLDLNDNEARFSASSYAAVAGYVAFARHDGAWDRGGITSSAARDRANHNTTLGVMRGSEYRTSHGPAATFGGVVVNDNDTLVAYTWYGDTDFNNTINFDDYVRTDNGFNNHLSGWFNGDFDLNGVINFDDYVLIDLAFNTQNGTLRRAMSLLDGSDRNPDSMNDAMTDSMNDSMSDVGLRAVEEHFRAFGDEYARHFLAAVPEPAGAAAASMAALLMSRRIRRRIHTR